MISNEQALEWKKVEQARFEGWDFSYLKGKMIEDSPSWDYIKLARQLSKKASSVLDMGTGGGEILRKINPKSKRVIATEGFPPNVKVARKNLKPLNIKLVDFSKHNVKNMPFPDNYFDLILNRHDAYDLKEVHRILSSGGIFLTQQVSTNNLSDLKKVFKVKSKFKGMTLKEQIPQFKKARLKIIKKEDFSGYYTFKNIGALVYYLHAIPWIVKNFSVKSHRLYLGKLQKKLEKNKTLKFKLSRFLIIAQKRPV